MGKTRFRESKLFAKGLGIIDSDGNLVEVFDEDFALDEPMELDNEKDDIITNENLEGTYEQTAALVLKIDGKEYFIPLVSDEG